MRNYEEPYPLYLHLHYEPNVALILTLDDLCPFSDLQSSAVTFGQSNCSYMVINTNRSFNREAVRVYDSRHHQKKILEFWVHGGFNVDPTTFQTVCKGGAYLMSVVCKLEKCKNSLLFDTELVGFMGTCKGDQSRMTYLTLDAPQAPVL